MWSIKGIRSCLYAGLFFSVTTLACPDYDKLPFYQAINNASNSHDVAELMKRWYTVKSNTGNGPTANPSTWPKSTLPYCFETDDARTQLSQIIKSGWKVWQSAGVNRRIDMGEFNDCPAPVLGFVPQNPNYLLIQLNHNGIILTTVGHQIYASGKGPTMQFDPNPALSMQDPVANMAHEIGHAWGFYHEQQRADFWSMRDYIQGTGSSSQINFDCTQLSDYARLVNSLGLDGSAADACHNQIMAKARRFSAMQYLPMPVQDTEKLDRGDFDWDSIMLYGSKIGAVPGANVYTRASDGAVIGFNKVPSTRDVQRFNTMYSSKAPYPNPCLINQGCSPWRAMFMKTKDTCKKIL